ncbi:MAG TPA: SDR family NAD(P)-dependent oxidoreductase [Vitreimonas sp.]|nr:SDR family NAD(P)-dependent oxidoreductase [Vitreimonas sp.]
MKKILITGGAGFIGSHLVELLIKNGYRVAVIDDLSGGLTDNVHPKASFYKIDIRKAAQVEKVFATFKPEVVYHLAANAAESKAQFSPMDITSRNYDGAIKVLTAAIRHGLKRFIFTSSIAVYGQLQTPFKETDKPEPEDIYGVTKLAFEDSLKILSQVHGFEYVITRPHNVYGPRQNMRDPYRNVVTIFMNALLQDKPFYIYGQGDQVRCFSYVTDVVEALAKCLSAPVAGMTFNVGSDHAYTVNELAEAILRVTGSSLEPIYLPQRPREVITAISDHQLSKQHLQYQDRTDLETGLRATWQWAKKQGYQPPRYTKIEIESPLLPQNWRR